MKETQNDYESVAENQTLKADSGSILNPIKDEILGSLNEEDVHPTIEVTQSFFSANGRSPRPEE